MLLHFIFNINYIIIIIINSPFLFYIADNYNYKLFLFSIGDTLVVGLIVAYAFASLFCLICSVLIFALPFGICRCLGVGIGTTRRIKPQKLI